ncbi:CLUMA_CG012212, isoform A [Clunio marinus]|uniref:CLUMA_CG012212, isoform A n=1 Tax=Clunio marinus TaxID=568069 RepID=A0A1J1IGX9_9DIPT|nr:CLUMA_CG012212, isoform A [Clunio marinus]
MFVLVEMKLFKEFQSACEQSLRCGKMNNESIQWKNCVYECVSPTCYKEIYEFDEVGTLNISIINLNRSKRS